MTANAPGNGDWFLENERGEAVRLPAGKPLVPEDERPGFETEKISGRRH